MNAKSAAEQAAQALAQEPLAVGTAEHAAEIEEARRLAERYRLEYVDMDRVRIDSELFARAAASTLKSFRAATNADLRQVRSLAMRTVNAGAVDTADSLARRMADVPNATNLFYILNNLYPGDPVTPGAAYKVVAVQ